MGSRKKSWQFLRNPLYINNMSPVVVIRKPADWNFPLSQDQYQKLLIPGLAQLDPHRNANEFLNSIIPKNSVGLKTNCLTGKLNPTAPPLAEAAASILKVAGIEANNIIIWDRTNRELKQAGHELNASSYGIRRLGTDTNGVDYSRDFFMSGEVASLVSNIMVEMIDHSINLPVLKDHSIAGLSGALKNMYGAVHNPNKYHDNNCSPFAAHVNNLEPLRTKHRLVITDAIRVQYQGGPGFNSRYLADYGGLIIATDPVAADRIGLEIVENFRKQNGLPSLEKAGRPVKYLDEAQKLGLGESKIDLIDLRVRRLNEDGTTAAAELLS